MYIADAGLATNHHVLVIHCAYKFIMTRVMTYF